MREIKLYGDTSLDSVRFSPGVIEADFGPLEGAVSQVLDLYEGWVPDTSNQEQYKEAKRARAHLNSVAKAIASARIEVKKQYSEPLTRFEERCKGIEARVKDAATTIDDAVRQYESEWRYQRELDIQRAFEDYAPFLAEAVDMHDLIAGEKWLNRTCTDWEEQLRDKVARIARDLDMLKKYCPGRMLDDAQGVYLKCLDVHKALAFAEKVGADRMRAKQLRDTVESVDGMEPEEACDYELRLGSVKPWQLSEVVDAIKRAGITDFTVSACV